MTVDYKISDGKILLGARDCRQCQKGLTWSGAYVTCSVCKGSGLRGRGKCSNCTNRCFPNSKGKVPDYSSQSPCKTCHGNYKQFEPADLYDYINLPENILISVIRSDRTLTAQESILGVGLLSCQDYGDHKRKSDQELIDSVKKSIKIIQACKIAKEDQTVANQIVILTADYGYSVLAVYQ